MTHWKSIHEYTVDVIDKNFFFLGMGSGMFLGWFAHVLVYTL